MSNHKKLKILQINKFNFVQGGADKYYLDISRELEKTGHQIIHFSTHHPNNLASKFSDYFVSRLDYSMKSGPLGEIRNGFRILGRIFWSFEAARKLKKLIQDFRPDIAHLHTIYHQISPSILPVLKKYHIPTVMTVHDFNLISCNYVRFHHREVCGHTVDGNFWRAIKHKCVKNSYLASALEAAAHYLHKWLRVYDNIDLFIFPSQFHAEEHLKTGFKMKNYVILPNYVAGEALNRPGSSRQNLDNQELSSSPRNKMDSLPPEFTPYLLRGGNDHMGFLHLNYIVSVGRLSEEKGIATLLDAVYKTGLKDLRLIIAGAGPQMNDLQLQVENLSLENQVEFVGHKDHADILKLIDGSRFMIFSSQALENQPLVILEAMSQGKPVIASDVGGVREIVISHIVTRSSSGQGASLQENGILFQPGDADDLAEKIKYLWSQPDLSAALGVNAKQIVKEKFNMEKHLINLTDSFQSLV